ncbi:MAG: hypothetical protein KIG57_07995, partial [Muribaculaceae bacterium]|nr:hypothetical protein [Muribaculaceae bacterium]
DCFFVNISKNLMAKLRMAFTEGKTNKECSYLGGLVGWKRTKSRYAKVGFAPKKTTPAEFRACNGAEIAP